MWCGCNLLATKKFSKTANTGASTVRQHQRRAHARTANSSGSTSTAQLLRSFVLLMALTSAVWTLPAPPRDAPAGLTAHHTTMTTTGKSQVLLAKFLAALQSHKHSGSSSLVVAPAAAATAVKQQRLRKRHSKRHSNWYDDYNYNENSTQLAWENPCGGHYVESLGSRPHKRAHFNRFYRILRKAALTEYSSLEMLKFIDLKDIEMWSLHNYTYKFLPKLKLNSSIALKRWYRNMQTYVGSLAYLRGVQLRWDRSKSQQESPIAYELKNLLISSRTMLCELETAVNNTQTASQQRLGRAGIGQLQKISRVRMNRRLKLRTRLRLESSNNAEQEADTIDLLFVKYYYHKFLHTMSNILQQHTRRHSQQAKQGAVVAAADSNEVENSAAVGRTRGVVGIGVASTRTPFDRLPKRRGQQRHKQRTKAPPAGRRQR